jgi:hypothetical protein
MLINMQKKHGKKNLGPKRRLASFGPVLAVEVVLVVIMGLETSRLEPCCCHPQAAAVVVMVVVCSRQYIFWT